MMKSLLTIAFAYVTLFAEAQNVFTENFTGCALPAGWQNMAVTGPNSWQFGASAPYDGGSLDGSCFAYIDDDALGSGAPALIADLVTPVIDLSAVGNAEFRFDYVFQSIAGSFLSVSFWNGTSWDVVWTENTAPDCFGFYPTCSPRQAALTLAGYLNSDFRAKFTYNDNGAWAWFVGLDNISVYLPPAEDAQLVGILSPINGCGLGSETVSLSIYNNGQGDISELTAGYAINGGVWITEDFTVSIAPGTTQTLTFSNLTDVSSVGTYAIEAFIEMVNDADADNDTVTATLVNIPVLGASLPYFEDFESGNGGWVTGGTNNSWAFGTPAGTFINAAYSGVNAWVTNLTGTYNNNENSYIESPCMDFSSLVIDPVLRFKHIFTTENCCDENWVDISFDGGTTWSRLGLAGSGENWYNNTFNNWWNGNSGAATIWNTPVHLLNGAAGQSSVKLRFFFSSDGSIVAEGIGIDDIEIFEQPAINAGVSQILSPLGGCGLGAEPVVVEVQNFGSEDISGFNVTYDAGNGPVTEVFTETLQGGASASFTFSASLDLSAFGSYTIQAWTELVNDGDASNDSTSSAISSIPLLSAALPYFENFENGDGGWTTGGTNSSWALGTPTGTFIDAAFSGVNAWVTNPAGNYNNNENSFIESPCMDFSSLLIDPVLRFKQIFTTENCCDEGWVDVSFDGGATWSRLGTSASGTNWYNNTFSNWWNGTSGGATVWRTAIHLLDGAAGQSSVKIRFFFSSDGSVLAEGFGIDDIEIFEQPSINAGVTAVLTPVTGCGLSASEVVSVTVRNYGDADLTDFSVVYDAGNGPISEPFLGVLAGNSDAIFTFATALDLSSDGTYNLVVYTVVDNDGDMSNDTISVSIVSSPVVNIFPYNQDFEADQGGWYSQTASGTANSWQWGAPTGAFINAANSGVNAWVTNLGGDYANGENSFIVSPCFDFSTLVLDPIISFAHMFDTETGFDETWIDMSIDNGLTWSRVGTSGTGENWYNNVPNNWWAGTSGLAGVWRNASNILSGAAGQSSVRLRFFFSSDGSVVYEGVGIDDVRIEEQPAINGAISAVTGPLSGCGLTSLETVTFTAENIGSEIISPISVSYQVNGGSVVTQQFTQSLSTGQSATLSFDQLLDLTVPSDYNLSVWINLSGDGDNTNDTVTVLLQSVPTIDQLPYFQDFETGSGGWVGSGTNGAWQLGDPQGNIIDAAFSGANAWATNLTTLNYNNNQVSYLTSPCIDFSNLAADPIIEFAIIYNTEAFWDGTVLQVSTNGGASYNTLGTVGSGINWYNSTSDIWWDGNSGGNASWVIAEHLLSGVAGQSNVRIRFRFTSDGSVNTYEGVAVDDINIYPQPQLDLATIALNDPTDGCNLNTQQVTFTFWNRGLATVSNFPVGFSVNGGSVQMQNVTTALAHGDTLTYTFTTQFADLSALDAHTLDVFTMLQGDENTGNDSLNGSVITNFGSNTGLAQSISPNSAISSTFPQGTSSTIYFCGLPAALNGGCFSIINVTLGAIAHTWISDLIISLISPVGDTLLLSANNGGTGQNLANVIFSETSTNDITLQTAGIAPGTYAPQGGGGFSTFYDGQDPNGGWTLLIQDFAGGNDGILQNWSMTFADNSPVVSLPYQDTTICLSHVLNLTVPTSYDSYLWSTGHNTQTASLFGNVLGLGTHEVFVSVDEDGCSGTSNSITVTVDACAGVIDLDGISIDMFPNPSEGLVTISVNGSALDLTLVVSDISGKHLQSHPVGSVTDGAQITLNVSALSSGVYFIQFVTEAGTVTSKLVVR